MKKQILASLAVLSVLAMATESQSKVGVFLSLVQGVKASKATIDLGSAIKKSEPKSYSSKPYILYLETVTPQDVKRCAHDDNCMDILPTSDLPARQEIFCKVDGETGKKYEFVAPMTRALENHLNMGGGLALSPCKQVKTEKNTYCNADGSGCHEEFDIMNPETEANQS